MTSFIAFSNPKPFSEDLVTGLSPVEVILDLAWCYLLFSDFSIWDSIVRYDSEPSLGGQGSSKPCHSILISSIRLLDYCVTGLWGN